MFVRTKVIKNKEYAYLVENQWTDQGARQKTIAYLGRIIPVGDTQYQQPDTQLEPHQFFVRSVSLLLQSAGFSLEGQKATKDDVTIQLTDHKSTIKNKPCALRINDGYLCEYTLNTLFEKIESISKSHTKQSARELASAIAQAGLFIDEETFILIYTKLVPNH